MVKRKVPAPARGELEEGLSQPAAPDTERTGKEDERLKKPALPAVSCRRRRDLCAAPAATTRTQFSRCQSQTEKEEECKRERKSSSRDPGPLTPPLPPPSSCLSHYLPSPSLSPPLRPPILPPALRPDPLPAFDATRHGLGVPSRALPPALPEDDG